MINSQVHLTTVFNQSIILPNKFMKRPNANFIILNWQRERRIVKSLNRPNILKSKGLGKDSANIKAAIITFSCQKEKDKRIKFNFFKNSNRTKSWKMTVLIYFSNAKRIMKAHLKAKKKIKREIISINWKDFNQF